MHTHRHTPRNAHAHIPTHLPSLPTPYPHPRPHALAGIPGVEVLLQMRSMLKAETSIIMLAAGVRHLIAVTEEGQCYSWGDGSLNRLGHGDTTPVQEPREISTLKSQRIISAAAGEVGKQGESWGAGPEDHWHFDEEQVGNLILHLRGGGSGMCGGKGGRGGRDSDDDDGGAAPTGSGPSGRGRAKRPKYDPFEGLDPWTPWNVNQVLVGVDGSGDGSGAG